MLLLSGFTALRFIASLIGTGVFVARDHRRALVGAVVGVAVAMLLLGLSLAVFRRTRPKESVAVGLACYTLFVRYVQLDSAAPRCHREW